tara:strand:+ start:746 stop:1837 length:1092 start_codon:yes stop_codon:yes gene_type:complete
MSPFEWFKKEKPLLSMSSMGGGATGPLMGGAAPNVDASGGTITEIGSKTIHQFTSSGSFVINDYNNPFKVELVVIGGGGGGAARNLPTRPASGGGAGGVAVDFFTYDIPPGTYPVTVGEGGFGGRDGGQPPTYAWNEFRGQGGGTSSVGFPGPKCPDIYGPTCPDWGAEGGGYGNYGGTGGPGGSGGGGVSGPEGWNSPFFDPDGNGLWIPNSAGQTPTVHSNGKRGPWQGYSASPVPENDMQRGYFGCRGNRGGGGAGSNGQPQNKGGAGMLLPSTFRGGNFGVPGNIADGSFPSPGDFVGGGGGGCGPPAGAGREGGGGAANNGTGGNGTNGTGGGGGGGLPLGGMGGDGQVLIAYSTKGD